MRIGVCIVLFLLSLGTVYAECIDDDADGHGAQGSTECLNEEIDCDDANPNIYPGATEICNGVDDNCDGVTDETGNALCDDGFYCNGEEICNGEAGCAGGQDIDCSDDIGCTADSCDEETDSCTHTTDDTLCNDGLFCNGLETCDSVQGCLQGTPADCTPNDIAAIAKCDNSPDDNDMTWDERAGFLSVCQEGTGEYVCTTGSNEMTHECSTQNCGAECEADANCPASECDVLDKCYDGTYRHYSAVVNSCLETCTCTENSCTIFSEKITDADADGYDTECDNDCNDANPNIYPGALESCNGLDDDCDGILDGSEGLSRQCGVSDIGICTFGTESCDDAGVWINCDAIMPQTEICEDGIDQNCDGKDDICAGAVFLRIFAGKDTFMREFKQFQNSNYGESTTLSVGDSRYWPFDTEAKQNNALIWFDLSEIPSNARILSADLSLFYYDFLGLIKPKAKIDVHKVSKNWEEGVGVTGKNTNYEKLNGTTWLARWYCTDDSCLWSNPGGDYGELLDTKEVMLRGWYSWDVKSGLDGEGFLLKSDTDTINSVKKFYSLESGKERAHLLVRYVVD
ncbi:putative metal-binding motif-containing protein [Candidatus Woesearchaeota archaeon]|nr:putative metal-binding motif-containing protein [Candidatus Woesearchaeota archaeon]